MVATVEARTPLRYHRRTMIAARARVAGVLCRSLLVAAFGGVAGSVHGAGLEWCMPAPAPAHARAAAPADTAAAPWRLAVYYVVPESIGVEPAVRRRLIEATLDMRAWYRCATGGRTWELAFPETVRVYRARHGRGAYAHDWWGTLLTEMGDGGHPIWTRGWVTALWVRGAGWPAGGNTDGARTSGVALLGVEIFPEFNDPSFSGGRCPPVGGSAAWPCTPVGAYAHELGHALGLDHDASTVAGHSVMNTHWNYPAFATGPEAPWGFLTDQLRVVRGSRFMRPDTTGPGLHDDCAIVNLPVSGPAPVAAFARRNGTPPDVFAAENRSRGASGYFWSFGDGSVSGDVRPSHRYVAPGRYRVRLRAISDGAMMAESAMTIVVPSPRARGR